MLKKYVMLFEWWRWHLMREKKVIDMYGKIKRIEKELPIVMAQYLPNKPSR